MRIFLFLYLRIDDKFLCGLGVMVIGVSSSQLSILHQRGLRRQEARWAKVGPWH